MVDTVAGCESTLIAESCAVDGTVVTDVLSGDEGRSGVPKVRETASSSISGFLGSSEHSEESGLPAGVSSRTACISLSRYSEDE